jgi:hypothetical protein
MAVSARRQIGIKSSSFWAVRVLTRIQTKREGLLFRSNSWLVFLQNCTCWDNIYIYEFTLDSLRFLWEPRSQPLETFHQCIHDSFGLKCNIRQLLYFPCLAPQPSWSTERLRSRNRRHMWHPAEVLKAHPPSGHAPLPVAVTLSIAFW